ncbi:MAG TPA: hypothetical protein VJ251_13480 [Stellaceae bacterium]|jgi:hypothetical protein|nr:hypothetical protein [Stellaceae bacterium]
MSVLTTLALMVTSFVAKPRPHDVEITELKALVDELNRQLMEAKTVAVRLGHQRDEARLEGDRWRALVEQYQGREEQQRPAGPDFGAQLEMERARAQMQQLMAMAQAQPYQEQQAQAQQYRYQATQQHALAAQLGAQNLDLEQSRFCNCVPARHDMFLPSGQRL